MQHRCLMKNICSNDLIFKMSEQLISSEYEPRIGTKRKNQVTLKENCLRVTLICYKHSCYLKLRSKIRFILLWSDFLLLFTYSFFDRRTKLN